MVAHSVAFVVANIAVLASGKIVIIMVADLNQDLTNKNHDLNQLLEAVRNHCNFAAEITRLCLYFCQRAVFCSRTVVICKIEFWSLRTHQQSFFVPGLVMSNNELLYDATVYLV